MVVPAVPGAVGVLSSAGFGVVAVAVEVVGVGVGVLTSVGFGVVGVEVLSSVDFPVAGCSLPQLLQKRALAGSITPQLTHFFVCPATPPLGCLWQQ